eukprot:7380867-Prymnesium_polylepis.1
MRVLLTCLRAVKVEQLLHLMLVVRRAMVHEDEARVSDSGSERRVVLQPQRVQRRERRAARARGHRLHVLGEELQRRAIDRGHVLC